MSFDVTVILPNNLRSGYLQSEFIAAGLAYTTNKYSLDANLDRNRNQISLGFELRDKTTRDIVSLRRINTLYISNDPYFEPSSTITITNWPANPDVFSDTINYTYNINANYFFDNTDTQGSFGSTATGTGLFNINNWALSANGGLSKVFVKAILEGPSNQLVEYPNGYGIYDTLIWEGELPLNPDNLEISALKSGWIGKNTQAIFKPASSMTEVNDNGIASYLVSNYEVSATGQTLDIKSSTGSTVYRSLSPTASIASTTCDTYQFYRNVSSFLYNSYSFGFDANIYIAPFTFYSGVAFYTKSKLLNTTTKPDFQVQSNFIYTPTAIGCTNSAYIKLYDQPDYNAGSKEIVMRLSIPNNANPTAYLYTIDNGVESVAKQTTTLPNSLLPLLQSGGNVELYYSAIDSQYAYVESYFTPDSDQGSDSRKSYLLASSIMSSFGTTYVGGAFQFDVDSSAGDGAFIKVRDLTLSQGKNTLSVDIGDCSDSDITGISQPISSIINTWTADQNSEYIVLTDNPRGSTITNSVSSTYAQVNKIDSADQYAVPGVCEVQLFKPSMSNRCSLEVKVLHKTDDFYIGFSNKSSYRIHNENGLQVEWDRPLGTRVVEDFGLSNNPVDAGTILVKFSKDKNQILVMQRNEDNTFSKTTLKTYKPSASFDRYIIEITDRAPSALKGHKKSSAYNATWIYVKTVTGNKLDLIGYAQLNQKLSTSENGLGYYAAVGFIKSSFDDSGSSIYNKVYELIYKSLPSYEYQFEKEDVIKTFSLTQEGLSNSKHYLGQKLLAGNTDFIDYGYKNPETTLAIVEVSAASTGANINISNLPSQTIDGVSLSTLALDSYVLLKDQIVNSENGIYKKTGTSTFELQSSPTGTPYKVVGGDVNNKSYFYKEKIAQNTEILEKFISSSFFCPITVDEISPFVASIRPALFEFKLNHINYDEVIDQSSVNVRFFEDLNGIPDYSNPLTDWISITTNPIQDNYVVPSNNSLIQVIMENSSNKSPLVSGGDKIWVLVSMPLNTAVGKAEGKTNSQAFVFDGNFTYYKLAENMWFKLFARYVQKSTNSNHKHEQHLRIRAKSHGKLESNATPIVGPVAIDLEGPKYGDQPPSIDNLTNTTLRNVELTILASDAESGIMAFRVGREIDNFRIQYTPWMPWSQFVLNNNGKYTIYLYGNLNYYTSGLGNTTFDLQNMGYSGPRKIWVQLMDYASNISQSYPLTFVSQAWSLLDTMPPIATTNFYNPKTNNSTYLTNITKPMVKMNANDIVSGVKDFKYRRIYDSGPDSWSEWEYYSPYKVFDFTQETDGVKKVEFVFRDYGNNATQSEDKWEIVVRPNK